MHLCIMTSDVAAMIWSNVLFAYVCMCVRGGGLGIHSLTHSMVSLVSGLFHKARPISLQIVR